MFYPIPDAPGYEINSLEQVRNVRTERFLKPYLLKGRPTPKFHIPKYHVRRTGKTLLRQAIIGLSKRNNFLPIPSAGNYEINSRGIVRNVRTKRVLKVRYCTSSECVCLQRNGKQIARSIKSLLRETWGIIQEVQHPPLCSVKMFRDGEEKFFPTLTECAQYLSKQKNCCFDTVRKKLSRRPKILEGWEMKYQNYERRNDIEGNQIQGKNS